MLIPPTLFELVDENDIQQFQSQLTEKTAFSEGLLEERILDHVLKTNTDFIKPLFTYYLHQVHQREEETKEQQQKWLNEALLTAVALNQKDQVSRLYKKGAQLQSKDRVCALGIAVRSEHLTKTAQYELVSYLLKLGANPNSLGTHTPPFFEAIHKKDMALIELFTKAGASVHELTSKTGRTVLMEAISTNSHEILQWVLEYEPNVNVVTKHKVSALSQAILAKNTEAIEALLQRGVKIHPFDRKTVLPIYQTPMFMAVADPDATLLKTFIERGAPLNIESENKTLLIYAIQKKHIEHVRVLIKAGINVNKVTKHYGNTALLFALEAKSADIIYELLLAGLKLNPKSKEANRVGKLAATKKHTALFDLFSKKVFNI